jgi:hypothetical protein
VNKNPAELLSTVYHASTRLLRRNPALWLTGFLVGVLVALTIATHSAAWDVRDGLQVVLAFSIAGLALPLGWVALECSRRVLAVRQSSSKE